jgi:hypothetical protein
MGPIRQAIENRGKYPVPSGAPLPTIQRTITN